MTITVPKAGSRVARSAAPRLQMTDGGAAVSDFGQQMSAIGNRLDEERLSREAQRINVDMARDLNDLRLEVSQIGDPDLADQAWAERSAELHKSYFEGVDENGRPRISEKNTHRLGVAFQELSDRHAYAVGQQTLQGRNAQREANLLQFRHEALRVAENSDPDLRATHVGQHADLLQELVDLGVYDAATATKMHLAFERDWDRAHAINLVDTDPQSFLDMSASGVMPGLDGELQASLRVQARANIESTNNKAMREAAALAKEAETVLGNRMSDIRDVVGAGMQSSDIALLSTDEAKAHPDYARTMAAVSLAQEQPNLATMTPAQIDALIAGEKSRPAKHKYQTERLEELERLKVEMRNGYEQDPVEYAKSAGLYVPDLPEFDAANPVAYARGLKARLGMAAEMEEAGYVKHGALFSDAERQQFEELIDSDQDPVDRVALAKSVAMAFGENTGAEISDLTDSSTFAWSATLLAAGVPENTARDILSGQTKLDQKTVANPSRARAIETFHAETDGIFADQPGLTENVLNAALAIYAEENPTEDPGDVDAGKFKRAIQRALGGSAGARGKLTVGGFDEIRAMGDRHTIPLPPRIDHDELDQALELVGDRLSVQFDRSLEGPLKDRFTTPDLAPLAAASLNGIAPDLGDPAAENFAPGEIWSNLQIAPYWPDGQPSDRYVLYRMRNGRPVFLKNVEGGVFEMSLEKLIGSAAQ